jgi:pyruvate dehydrogenase E2 component (dihydrolipoamide acetyltransferase)
MATGVYLPIWGMQMEEGRLIKWLVSEGDRVEKGDPLVEIETEKITNVVESPANGIIAKIVAKEGEVIKITGLLAVILQEGEEPASVEMVIAEAKAKEGGAPARAAEALPKSKEAAVEPAASAEIKASPLAKKIAQENGIDLGRVRGTGPEARIVKEDVLAYIEEMKSKPSVKAPEAPSPPEDKSFEGEILQMSQTRKVIARRTLESIRAPQGTLTREVDLSEVLKFRKSIMPEFEGRYGLRLALTPIFVKALAVGVKEVPILNSRIEGDKVYISHKVHVGVVVRVKDAIVIPVIFNVQSEITGRSCRSGRSFQEASEGTLKLEEITGSTITISNVGMGMMSLL